MRTEAVYRMPPEELGMEVASGVGLAGQVLLRRQPLVLRRYGDVPDPVVHAGEDDAVIGIPILQEDEMIGFFGIGIAADPASDNRPRRYFDAADVETLTLFARHAAVAIDNARRYRDERRRRERLELIARIGRIITAELRLEELLQSSANAIHELLGYPNVAIPLLGPADENVLVLRVTGGHYRKIIHGEYRIPIDQGLMGAAARERETVLVNDVASDPRHLPTPGAVGITAELAVPILLGDRVLGVLNVESGEAFDQEDAAGLRVIADQLAVGIEHARLYEQAQRFAVVEERQRLARELHDSVTQQLFGVTLMAESLEVAWDRDPREGARRTRRVLELSRAALAEMRALLSELRPDGDATQASGDLGILRNQGLVVALRKHVAAVRPEGMEMEVRVDGYREQPFEREEAMLRITQEALANAIKHAGAAKVCMSLHDDGVTIEDDGRGFDASPDFARPVRDDHGHHLGLATMHERAEALGGNLRIRSTPGSGTRITVRLPPSGTASTSREG